MGLQWEGGQPVFQLGLGCGYRENIFKCVVVVVVVGWLFLFCFHPFFPSFLRQVKISFILGS